ncbi:MAG: response regulator transcription factor [Flavobacteriia bacterium]|nr:response regulator transcription factor [Flavobacteriia bacterium]
MRDQPTPNIAVVDDDKVMRTLVNGILKDRYELKLFSSGKEALSSLYDGELPHLMILDLNMPEISGLETLKRIRESAFYKELMIVMLSAEESSNERVACFEAGANDYLVKPFNPKELHLRIDNLLRIKGYIL